MFMCFFSLLKILGGETFREKCPSDIVKQQERA